MLTELYSAAVVVVVSVSLSKEALELMEVGVVVPVIAEEVELEALAAEAAAHLLAGVVLEALEEVAVELMQTLQLALVVTVVEVAVGMVATLLEAMAQCFYFGQRGIDHETRMD